MLILHFFISHKAFRISYFNLYGTLLKSIPTCTPSLLFMANKKNKRQDRPRKVPPINQEPAPDEVPQPPCTCGEPSSTTDRPSSSTTRQTAKGMPLCELRRALHNANIRCNYYERTLHEERLIRDELQERWNLNKELNRIQRMKEMSAERRAKRQRRYDGSETPARPPTTDTETSNGSVDTPCNQRSEDERNDHSDDDDEPRAVPV